MPGTDDGNEHAFGNQLNLPGIKGGRNKSDQKYNTSRAIDSNIQRFSLEDHFNLGVSKFMDNAGKDKYNVNRNKARL